MRSLSILVLTLPLVLTPAAGRADPPGSPAAAEALARCRQAERTSDARAQRDLLADSVRRAEAAIDTDAEDARAHFALFCGLGRQVEAAGLSFRNAFAVRRLHLEIETAQTLAPDDPDVLTARGAFLMRLPSIFGGDATEGRRLLERAVAIAPDHPAARALLVAVRRAP